ncbi:DNA-directed RNA polymerases II, IV and V subunit 9B, partial [Ananas comosus]
EVAENNCVYRNVVDHSVDEFTQVLEDVASDPTLPRTKSVRCATCGHGEAVFFQATTRAKMKRTMEKKRDAKNKERELLSYSEPIAEAPGYVNRPPYVQEVSCRYKASNKPVQS